MWLALRKSSKHQVVINLIKNLSGVITTQIRTTILGFWVMEIEQLTFSLSAEFWLKNLMHKVITPEGPRSLGK